MLLRWLDARAPLQGRWRQRRRRRATQCFFFGNFGSEIQIGNEQVWGKNWVKKVVINKFSVGKK